MVGRRGNQAIVTGRLYKPSHGNGRYYVYTHGAWYSLICGFLFKDFVNVSAVFPWEAVSYVCKNIIYVFEQACSEDDL